MIHGTRNCYKKGCRLPECIRAAQKYRRQSELRTGRYNHKKLDRVHDFIIDEVISILHGY